MVNGPFIIYCLHCLWSRQSLYFMPTWEVNDIQKTSPTPIIAGNLVVSNVGQFFLNKRSLLWNKSADAVTGSDHTDERSSPDYGRALDNGILKNLGSQPSTLNLQSALRNTFLGWVQVVFFLSKREKGWWTLRRKKVVLEPSERQGSEPFKLESINVK